MQVHTIRYRIRPETRDDHERLLTQLLADLKAQPVPGLRYDAFRGDGDAEYLHLIAYDKAGSGPLQRPPALADFHDRLRERCDGEPRRETLRPIEPATGDQPHATETESGRSHHDRWRHLHN